MVKTAPFLNFPAAKWNAVFIVMSCLAAHLIPFELLLGAYAFLGPAHYLTEFGTYLSAMS
jgi:hypothetical protein